MEQQKYILALVGITMSGKTTIMKSFLKLAEENCFSIHRLLPLTTRPMREEDKIDPANVFVEKSKFDEIVAENGFFSTAEFTISNGKIYYYGVTKESIYNTPKLSLLISNPTEVNDLENNLPDGYTLLPVSLDVSSEELNKRLQEATDRGEDEAADRIKRDWDVYSEFSKNSNVFNLNVSYRTPEEISNELLIHFIDYVGERL